MFAESACGDLTRADVVQRALARVEDASLLTSMRAARAVVENHGRGAATDARGTSTSYAVPRAARERIAREIAGALEEYDAALRAPLRVVALGRSGVGKSHVLNQLLSELASRRARDDDDDDDDDSGSRERQRVDGENHAGMGDEGLTIVSAVDHDEAAEEREADRTRALEDEGETHVRMAADASVFAPPPPLDRDKSCVVYAPRHMKGRAIAGEAAKFADEVQIRKDRIKELSAKLSKKNAKKVKPSYALYKEEMEEKARQAAAKVAAQQKKEDYERIVAKYEVPVRDFPFNPPLVPIDEFLSDSPRAPFLLPEGDILDTTSVASSVSTSDAFRVTLVYFSEEVVKKHLHALRHAAREARLVAKHRPQLGFFAEKYAKKELEEQGFNELTLLDFPSKPDKNSDDGSDSDDECGLPSVLRVACAMVGLDPNRSSLDAVEEAEVALPAEYIKRLGKRVTFEYRPEGKGNFVDYSNEEIFRRGLLATKRTLVTQTHIPAACWGLLREVRVEIPVPEHKRGLVLIDAPGAGDSDPARDRHLVAALRNAAAVICLGDARDVTGDIVRALHKSGFLQQLTIRPATRRFINAIQGDRVWGTTHTTFKMVQTLVKERLGKDVSFEDFMRDQPPKREDIQWAVDHVLRENSEILADIRRTELVSMLTDPSGSVRELPQVANAVSVVAWKFLEIRSSWARVLDASKIDVQNITGHGSLYAELEVLKHSRKLKLVRRVTKRVHDALKEFCTAAGPMHALPESSDESLRGLHESLELAFGERGEYASKVIHRDTTYFIRRTCASLFNEGFKAFNDRIAGECHTSKIRDSLSAAFADASSTLRVSDVQRFANHAVQVLEVVFRDAFCLKTESGSSDVLIDACSEFVNGWYKIIATEDEQSLHAFTKKTLMNLTGDEEDPKCAIVRAIVSIAVAKFKLGPASKLAYLSHGQKKDAIRGLHVKLVKDLSKEISTQARAIKAGIIGMFTVEDAKDDAPATEEEAQNFFNNCTTLVSLCAVTVADALTDALHEGITAWIQSAITSGSKDAVKSTEHCLMPLIKKQVMPDFRARVAKRSMLTIINEDIADVENIMSVTADVLGADAKSDITQLEKAKRLAELARMGDEPVRLNKPSLPMPPPNPAFRAPDDVVQVDLSEFPIRIYAPDLKLTVPLRDVIPSMPAVEAVVRHPSPCVAEEIVPEAPQVQIKLDIQIVSPEPAETPRSHDVHRREIGVQTDEIPPSLPTAMGPAQMSPNFGEAPRQNSSSKSGKSDATATPTTKLTLDSKAPLSSAPKVCNHCGDTSSSVWKKGPSIKPTLCVACRDYLDKRWTLPKLSRKSRNNTPTQKRLKSLLSTPQPGVPTEVPATHDAPKRKEDAFPEVAEDISRTQKGKLPITKSLADNPDVSDEDDSPVPKSKVRLEWVREDEGIKCMRWGAEAWKPVNKVDSRHVKMQPPAETHVQRHSSEPSTTAGASASGVKRKRPVEATATGAAVIEAPKSPEVESADVAQGNLAFESGDEDQRCGCGVDASTSDVENEEDNAGKDTKNIKEGLSGADADDALHVSAPPAKMSTLAALDALGDDDKEEEEEERWVSRFAKLHSPKRPRT